MAHVELELARDRHRNMQAAAALHRDARRAQAHGRMFRQAERAERRKLRSSGLIRGSALGDSPGD